jgi:hypothetical protein
VDLQRWKPVSEEEMIMSGREAADFFAAFYPDENEEIHLRLFAPKKAPHDDARFAPRKLIVTRYALATDGTLVDKLKELNATRGLYFAVNAGGDTDDKITRFNACFVEDDTRSIGEQHQKLNNAPLLPSIRVETQKSVHAFWLLEDECSERDWRKLQQRIIAYTNGDEKNKNPSRVMRVPFFNHVRYDQETGKLSYKRVELIEFEPGRRYTVSELLNAFPPVNESSSLPSPSHLEASRSKDTFASWEELHAEIARRIRLTPNARTNSKGWTHAPGVCHESTDGTAIAVSPEGAYKCHKGCPTDRIRAAYGLPVRPNTDEPETGMPRSKESRSTGFTFTTLKELLVEPEETVAWVWHLTLPSGGFAICAAKPKVGKSTLARNLALAVSRGEEFFGRPTKKGKVIYLCLEEKRAEVAAHFRRMGASEEDILIYTGRTPAGALAALERAIDEQAPALVIIDPLSRFVRVADFNSYGDVTRGLEPLIDLARSAECQPHILAVHHNSKGERQAGEALLGSTGFFGAVDTLLTMKKREKVRTLETIQRYGEDLPETMVNFDPKTGLITPGDDMEAVQLYKCKLAVLESVGDEELKEADIKERVGGSAGLVSKAIRSLCEEGLMERTGSGTKGDPYLYKRPRNTGAGPSLPY